MKIILKKIGDFGTNKITINTDNRTGTPSYMAFEIISGKAYNNKIDIFC